ncbi:MAG: DUF4349 domain-containing protein [Oscillospiraceae bacterium]|nr:DUF4349 domain-containing protein [Oscillospiraceae bacterium]
MRKKLTILAICLLSFALLAAACGSHAVMRSASPESGQFLSYRASTQRYGAPPVFASGGIRQDMAIGGYAMRATSFNLDEETGIIPGQTWRDALSSQAQLDGISYTDAAPISEETTRMLIRDANVSVETRSFEAFFIGVQNLARELGGHVQNSSMSDHSYRRSANLTLRVPAEALDDFLAALADDYTRVTSINEWVRDVTMQHNDMTAELDALRVEEEALLRLLAQSGNLSDLLAVQNQLTRVRHQINRLEGEVRLLENQVSLSTVDMHIWEVERLPLDEEAGFWARIGDGFLGSLRNLGAGIANFFAGAIIFLPYIILVGAVAIIVLVIVRRRVRKWRNKRKEATQEE